MADEDRWESKLDPSLSRALVRMVRRLPSIRAEGREGRRLSLSLRPAGVSPSPPKTETLYAWIEGLCSTPHRRPGSPEGHRAEAWVRERLEEIGLSGISVDPVPITLWTADGWSLEVDGKPVSSFYIPHTAFTASTGIRTPLVYAGQGGAGEMKRAGVRGKIVVADAPFPFLPTGLLLKHLGLAYHISDPEGSLSLFSGQRLNFVRPNFIGGTGRAESAPPTDAYWNAVKGGAAGICLILKDQPGGTNSHYGPYDGILKPMPGLWIGKHEGVELRRLASGQAQGLLTLTGSHEPGTMHNVWGMLPGRSDEIIMISSHHDSPFRGATEDGAGVAQVLAQAWAWSQVPQEERKKTLVFVIDGGHFYGSRGAHAFAREHPEIMKRTRLLITLEHLGAKEVREEGRGYAETGRLSTTVMFTTPDPQVISVAIRALTEKPAKSTVVIPSDLIAPVPTSDASGFVVEAQVPVISWIGCPSYLLDEHDTLDKVDQGQLIPICETVTELVRGAMELS